MLPTHTAFPVRASTVGRATGAASRGDNTRRSLRRGRAFATRTAGRLPIPYPVGDTVPTVTSLATATSAAVTWLVAPTATVGAALHDAVLHGRVEAGAPKSCEGGVATTVAVAVVLFAKLKATTPADSPSPAETHALPATPGPSRDAKVGAGPSFAATPTRARVGTGVDAGPATGPSLRHVARVTLATSL